jgi:hypothetical protein
MAKTKFYLDKPRNRSRQGIDRVLTIIFIGEQILLMLYIIFKKGADIVDFLFR